MRSAELRGLMLGVGLCSWGRFCRTSRSLEECGLCRRGGGGVRRRREAILG